MGSADAAMPRVASHFTILTYAFQHRFSGPGRSESLRALSGRWHHWWFRLGDRALETALDDIYFFLPHVHRVLFPEALLLGGDDLRARVPAARRLAGRAPADLGRLVSPDAMLRITYDPVRLDRMRRLGLSLERRGPGGAILEQFVAPFEVTWVDAVLFPQRVGFLALKVRLLEPGPTVDRVNDFHYYLRAIHPPRLDSPLADWTTTEDPRAVSCKARDVIDYLLQGLTEQPDPRSPTLGDSLVRKSEAGRPSQTPFGNVYGQYFRLYHYGCLAGSEPPDWPSGSFDSPSERALYELATCTDTRLLDYRPDATYVRDLVARHRIALWDNWKGLALHDNVAFLALREGPFTLGALPHNIEHDYFNLFLLTLFHKNRLALLTGQMMGHEGRFLDRVRRARLLWEDFRNFQDDYWLGEVTHRPQGLEIHRKFRDGLGIGPAFDELRDKVREYQEFHELKIERQVSDMLTLLTFVGVPAGALCSLFGSALGFHASWTQFVGWLVGVWAALSMVWLLWTRRDEVFVKPVDPFSEADDRQSP